MKKKVRTYSDDDIDVSFDAIRCIHAEECVHGLPGVFDANKRPWIDPGAGSADEIAAVVLRCPTGALSFTRKDGGPEEVTPGDNVITVEPNGPLYVYGNVELKTEDGELHRETRAALCRCGLSENKPLCDNTHKDQFEDAGAIGEQARPAEPSGESPLQIAVAPGGPLIFNGPVEIRSADGTRQLVTARGALCRCGASKNKPFCDGTHKEIGFGK